VTQPPTLRIVRGAPTPEELAVVTAVVAAASAAAQADRVDDPRRGRWNDPAAGHRRPWNPGLGAWRASVRSR
jgi:Acyl-CoA carboxylase epsilon subunit